jgi:diguanylate cyclase (GGDEF)-like protein
MSGDSFDLAAQQLVELLELVSSFSDEASAAQGAVERAAQVLEAEVAAVVLSGHVVYSVGFPAGAIPVDDLVEVTDGKRDMLEVPRLGVCSVATAELDSTGQGHLVIARLGDDGFSAAEWNLLRGMSRILDLSLQMLRTMDSLRQRQRLMEHLYDIQRSISRRLPLIEVLETVVRGVRDLLRDQLVGLLLPDPDNPATLLLICSVGLDDERAAQMWRMSAAEAGAAGQAILTDELSVAYGPASAGAALSELTHSGLAATMAAPVRESTKITGSLFTSSTRVGRMYTEIDREILLAFAENVSLALTDAKTVSDMNEAFHDSLTGLASRALFLERLGEGLVVAEREGTRLALLFIDLDRFKLVNDTFGHATGDMLLIEVAERIGTTIRGGDVAARFGGDEFAVILQSVTPCQADAVVHRIIESVAQGYHIGGEEMSVGASIGVTLSVPGEQLPIEELIRRADVAMYQAKRNGRGRAETFEPGMDMRQEQSQVNADLRRAAEELVRRATA